MRPSPEIAARKLVANYYIYRTSAVPAFEDCLDRVAPAAVRTEESDAAR